jgi:hypothetical protein
LAGRADVPGRASIWPAHKVASTFQKQVTNHMELLLIGAAAVLVLGLIVWRMRSQSAPAPKSSGSRSKSKQRAMEALDTVISWQPQATRVLTVAERKMFNSLRNSLPDHLILAQVPLARFLKVPTRYSYSEWLRRVGLMCADLVVCDSSSQVVAVVDIRQPEAIEHEKAKLRNARMDRVIRGADIAMYVWREDALPNGTVARNTILQLPLDTPMDVPVNVAVPASLAPTDRGLSFEPPTDDEVVEAGEPPPSTWFDDMDSAPAPLGPPQSRVQSVPPSKRH